VALGTPAYMAPEQAADDPEIDHRADIYAVGVLGYEILTGRPPFADMPPQQVLSAQVTQQPTQVRKTRADIPSPLATLVMKCLEKKPEARFQSADELLARLEAMTTPSGGITPIGSRPFRAVMGGRRSLTLGIAAAVLVALAGVLWLQSRSVPRLDPDLLVIAPFDVLDTDLELWREGLVDVLSASLDGAGALRTVSPTAVIQRWTGRAEASSARQLGRSLGAGLAVYGRLIASGQDSVRLSATLLDVGVGQAIGEMELRDSTAHVDRLADSLAVRLLSELGRRDPSGALRSTSFGSSSPTALRAFLQGERQYRLSNWDSATAYYGRATQLDTAFALAFSRLGAVVGWRRGGRGSARFALQAGALNHGLAPRESLLVAADSVEAALLWFDGDSTSWSHLGRLFTTLDRAIGLYPGDPGSWYRLGEARYRWGAYVGATSEQTLTPFIRALELDPGFAPAYIPLIALNLGMGRVDSARRVMSSYLDLDATGSIADGVRLAASLLDARERGRAGDDAAALDTLSVEALQTSWSTLSRAADSAESGIRVARELLEKAPNRRASLAQRRVAWSLAFRGHIREAYEISDTSDVDLYTEMALLNVIPDDSVALVCQSWLTKRHGVGIYPALPWWAAQGDTLSLGRAVVQWEDFIQGGLLSPSDTAEVNYARAAASAYLAVARGDTALALGLFANLPDWPRRGAYRERLTHARLLAASERVQEAAHILDQVSVPLNTDPRPGEVIWMLEHARIQERLGNLGAASRVYAYVANAWFDADSELQPTVREAHAALDRFTGTVTDR
ncbi:MAG: protein kinase, partial [Gemmatimonadales bacterium]|nr:protein kinase [Gemmatimonadales bacterium]